MMKMGNNDHTLNGWGLNGGLGLSFVLFFFVLFFFVGLVYFWGQTEKEKRKEKEIEKRIEQKGKKKDRKRKE